MARLAGRQSTTRRARESLARFALTVVLFVVSALLWLLIMNMLAEGFQRAIPAFSCVSAAIGWIP